MQISNKDSGIKILIVFSMLYMSLMLFNAILTNRYIGWDSLFVLGGTLTSPFIFILDDIIAEIYGYKTTRCLILAGFTMQLLFSIFAIIIINHMPHPSFFVKNQIYDTLLGASLLHITISGFVAYTTANLINIYILTKWKVLLKGKKFWLRSMGSSIFSEILYSCIAIVMMELGRIPSYDIIKVAIISASIKITYSILLALPANFITQYVKKTTGIDVYDLPPEFTPMRFFKLREAKRHD